MANCTFKKRLGALQAQKGQSSWAALLPELALVTNTTTSQALPRHKTPFEVWFGRKSHWITAGPMEDIDIYDETDAESDDDGDLVLTEIEARVVANNARLHAQMIKANSGRSALLWTDQLLLSRSHLNYGLLQNHQGCQYGSSSIKWAV